MKKQLIAIFLGVSVVGSNALAYLGPNDKSNKPNKNPKGANCSPATAKLFLEFNWFTVRIIFFCTLCCKPNYKWNYSNYCNSN